MEVEFSSRQLLNCYQEFSRASRAWGRSVARKYIQRVNILYVVRGFDELYKIRSLRLHRLSGRRAGQFAIDLDQRWRLIINYQEAVDKILVLEVTNHYDD